MTGSLPIDTPTAELRTIDNLRAVADRLLYADRYPEALAAYRSLVEVEPRDLDVRLRIGDALLALGRVQPAAVVYAALARHAARAGYPLRALVALKQLAVLEPQLGVLLEGLAELYAKGSPHIGRGARVAPPEPTRALPEGLVVCPAATLSPNELDELVALAQGVASNFSSLGMGYPQKLVPIPLFSELPAKDFAAMLAAMALVRVRPGVAIIAEGEPGDAFYVLARGAVRVTRGQGEAAVDLATLHEGAIFGEMALLRAEPRSATVMAVGDADLLRFDARALEAVASQVQAVAQAFERFSQQRLIQNLLATAPLFRPLDRRQRLDLMRRFTAYEVAPATSIIRQGEPGRGLFLLLRGEVQVTRDDGAGPQTLAQLKAGDLVGELSLLHDEPATATVTSGPPTTVLFLAREVFRRLVDAVPEIRVYVERLGEERSLDTRLAMDALSVRAADALYVDCDETLDLDLEEAL